jgi:hypothetical protein
VALIATFGVFLGSQPVDENANEHVPVGQMNRVALIHCRYLIS